MILLFLNIDTKIINIQFVLLVMRTWYLLNGCDITTTPWR